MFHQDLNQRSYYCWTDLPKPCFLDASQVFGLFHTSPYVITPSVISTIRVTGLSVCPRVISSRLNTAWKYSKRKPA